MSTPEVREAVKRMAEVLVEQPQKGRSTNPSATATLEAGLRFLVTGPKGEAAVTDMPPPLGGKGSAPSPGWLMRASLAACNATMIAIRAAQRGVTLTTLEVTVTSESDVRGFLGTDESVSAGLFGLRSRVKIGAAGAPPEQIREIVSWAEAHSPIGCTVRDANATAVEVEVV
jgi:uncharacterized OsmC-like protein